MDVGSVNMITSTASAMSQMSFFNEVNTSVMRKSLDITKSQAADIVSMIDQQKPALATSGSVGTRINTTA